MTHTLIAIADSAERQSLLDSAIAEWTQTLREQTLREQTLRESDGRDEQPGGDSTTLAIVAWLPESTESLVDAIDAKLSPPGCDSFLSKLWSAVRSRSAAIPPRVVLIGSACSYRDERRDQAEMRLAAAVRDSGAVVRLLRVGEVLSAEFGLPRSFARKLRWRSLSSGSRHNSFLAAAELITAVNAMLSSARPRYREHALLGQRRSLREALEEYSRQATALGQPASERSWSHGLGRLAGMFRPAWKHGGDRGGDAPFLPTDQRRLIALCGALNRPHVALAGFNTGVNHFGWRYPGKTLVQTVRAGQRIRLRGEILEADASLLIKDAVAVLRKAGYEFLVLPNYSYVSLGTVFMVPVHGSGCEVSTLGETIVKVLVYDPSTDRIVRLRRDDPRFARWMYNPESGVVVLRLWFRVRPCFRYFRQRRTLTAPSAAELWNAFRDPDASHIEARKQRAADPHVSLYRYRLDSAGLDGHAEELPRDTIGRVWDRIEQNRLAASMFHAFVRNFGFHVELFLNESEFALFWQHHRDLPLAKMQFRLARRDGLPHSPCGDCDRMSIDLFMSRRRSARFLAFVKEHLPHARFNRGKHSM